MKIKYLFWVLFLASLFVNFYFVIFDSDNDKASQVLEKTGSIYPDSYSSFEHNISFEPEYPVYSGYTTEGDETEFLNFRLEGTIVNSVKKKYDMKVSRKLVRNIQEIVYFMNNFKIRFSRGDRISLIYRKKDSKIVFLRFKSALKRSVHEVFLFNDGSEEQYITSAYEYLQPCITNGPFEGCPQVTFVTDGKFLVPVFNTGFNEKIRIPFLAKLINTSDSYRKGGEMMFAYSNFATKAVFKGFAKVNTSLKKNTLYHKGVFIGESGFIVNSIQKGIIYYLKKGENRVVSPFIFHHTEPVSVDKNQKINIRITRSFYRDQYKVGIEFETDYY